MPIYEYVCGSCAKKTEVIQRIGERPLRVCPHCGGKLKKAISAPAIQFKGSGFYITDYARASSEGGKAKKDSGEKAESKSENTEKTEKTESAGKSEKVEKKADKKEKKAT
ncbi:MAG: FmdB family zinc ribbon protein [Syntrophomonadaceae bacterium]